MTQKVTGFSAWTIKGVVSIKRHQCVLASDYDALLYERDALLSERDALNMERGWVSVEDRLPEISRKEIILWNGRWQRLGYYLDSLKHGPGFYSPFDERLRGITHWMPLLPPPNGASR